MDYQYDDTERTQGEIWNRFMGYLRPITYFKPGKQQEHKDRKYYKESVINTYQDPFNDVL
jgi:hypothetical protein